MKFEMNIQNFSGTSATHWWGHKFNVLNSAYGDTELSFYGTMTKCEESHLIFIKGTLLFRRFDGNYNMNDVWGFPITNLTSAVGVSEPSKIVKGYHAGEYQQRQHYGIDGDTSGNYYQIYATGYMNGMYGISEIKSNGDYQAGRVYNKDGAYGGWSAGTIGTTDYPFEINLIVRYTD